jgi:hypothetical protein
MLVAELVEVLVEQLVMVLEMVSLLKDAMLVMVLELRSVCWWVKVTAVSSEYV